MFKSIRQRLLVMLGLTSIDPLVFISMYSYLYFKQPFISINNTKVAYLNSQTTNRLNDLFFKSIAISPVKVRNLTY